MAGRSPEDEKYLSCIVEVNPASKFVYIVDTRPKINALYNRWLGIFSVVIKGPPCRFFFIGNQQDFVIVFL